MKNLSEVVGDILELEGDPVIISRDEDEIVYASIDPSDRGDYMNLNIHSSEHGEMNPSFDNVIFSLPLLEDRSQMRGIVEEIVRREYREEGEGTSEESETLEQ